MPRLMPLSVLSLASILAFGCAEAPPPPPAPAATPAPTAEAEEKHASAEVVPGSYEDWCGEHSVPESQCTRCNAALIPAFKATGDWCEVHQLPKSQDLADNPDLKIVRPPKSNGGA